MPCPFRAPANSDWGVLVAATPGGKFDALLSNIQARWAYRDLNVILKAEGLGGPVGWEALLARLNEADGELSAKADKLLRRLNGDLAIAGTKDVHVFPLDPADALKLADAMAAVVPLVAGKYTARYPLSLPDTDLKAMSVDHELAASVHHPNGDVSLVLCAKRSDEERVHYDYSEVTAAVQSAFTGVDEFITIKKTDFQVFDVLTVRRQLARVEVLIDQPGLMRLPETSESRCLRILGRAMTLLPVLQPLYESNTPLNLFPCISAIYHKATEGRVSRLSFRSPTESIKKESMTSRKDLRTEAFHDAGVKAVGDIIPYDITVIWDSLSANVASGTGVRIGLPIAGLSGDGQYVREARVINASSDVSVVAIVNKLVSYST